MMRVRWNGEVGKDFPFLQNKGFRLSKDVQKCTGKRRV